VAGARVGTSSLRRRVQIQALRPDLTLVDLRGNVDTRIRKLREGECEAIVLAMAGLIRLGCDAEATEALDPSVLLPAPGQGVIALECRADDARVWACVVPLHDVASSRAATAERAFLSALGGGCNRAGAFAEAQYQDPWLRGFVAPGGARIVRGEASGSDPHPSAGALPGSCSKGARALLT
jgi:hydroxymethylbilane synthase